MTQPSEEELYRPWQVNIVFNWLPPWTWRPQLLCWAPCRLCCQPPYQWRSGEAGGCQTSAAGWWALVVLGPKIKKMQEGISGWLCGQPPQHNVKAFLTHLVFLHNPLYPVVDFASIMGHSEVRLLAELVPADVAVITELLLHTNPQCLCVWGSIETTLL